MRKIEHPIVERKPFEYVAWHKRIVLRAHIDATPSLLIRWRRVDIHAKDIGVREHLRHLHCPASRPGANVEDAARVLQGRGIESPQRVPQHIVLKVETVDFLHVAWQGIRQPHGPHATSHQSDRCSFLEGHRLDQPRLRGLSPAKPPKPSHASLSLYSSSTRHDSHVTSPDNTLRHWSPDIGLRSDQIE